MKRSTTPWILGISASHNGSACLLRGDRVVVAIQEERLSRIKRDCISAARPSLAIEYCLKHAGIQIQEIDLVVYGVQGRLSDPDQDYSINPQLRLNCNNNKTRVLTVGHHLGHAAGAYATSGFEASSILVVDGMGSPATDVSEQERAVEVTSTQDGWETISMYRAERAVITPLEKHFVTNGSWLIERGEAMSLFRSLGGMFSAVARQIFGDFMEAGKVMGLAPYGQPLLPTEQFFRIIDGTFAFSDAVPARFPCATRWPMCSEEYATLAASTQTSLDLAILYLARRLSQLYRGENLCYAGGVALNAITNERLYSSAIFSQLHFLPACDDSGVAVGAAYCGLWHLLGEHTKVFIASDSFGSSYTTEDVLATAERIPAVVAKRAEDVIERTAEILASGAIVGWFQRGGELGPRALGCRSILLDPRLRDGKAILNSRVKFRESFRPFAPVCLAEYAEEWFDIAGADPSSPFMLRICKFHQDKIAKVPSVVHVDGSGRLQTITPENDQRLYKLLHAFYCRTGVPLLLNTSLNVAGEPIVETPEEAMWCLLATGIDYCVLGDVIINKAEWYKSHLDLIPIIVSDIIVQERRKQLPSGTDFTTVNSRVLSCVTKTRWGLHNQHISSDLLPVLDAIDGCKSGWMILRELSATDPTISESLLLYTLARLKRYRIIDFTRN
ncbi:MAG: carbamoyltransferase family protein [Bryobacteraceae bacterium]